MFAANPLGIPWGSVGLGGLGGLVRGLGGLQPSPQLIGLSLEIQKQQLARHQKEQTQLLTQQLQMQAAAQGAVSAASAAGPELGEKRKASAMKLGAAETRTPSVSIEGLGGLAALADASQNSANAPTFGSDRRNSGGGGGGGAKKARVGSLN